MRERRKERRDIWKRRGREVILIWGERKGGVVGRRSNMENSHLSRLNRMALNCHGGDR
jgi:hypothetical protein